MGMDLFSESRERSFKRVAPLAVRMRPTTLEEFAGQEHFLGEGKLLRRLLQADRLSSAIFYGPPGTGKTTLAHLIALHTKCHFEQLNAASAGVKEVRAILDDAKDRLASSSTRTVLFLDEIHRFNRAQQDILLPDVENGLIILIGATTENPFFSVNSPLISRSGIFQFNPLTEGQIIGILQRSATDMEKGLGYLKLKIDEGVFEFWATTCDGDARRAITALEVAALSLGPDQPRHITMNIAQESIQRKAIVYDGIGDEHYDAASALIKSMRGSDPDAAVYWVAKMLEAGEDPRFIARRIAILASEDIGNADPRAIMVASAAYAIVERIGMPEAQLTLAQAAIYMATAPKSNASAMAIWTASSDIKEGRTIPVPRKLRDTHYKGSKQLGHGQEYQYPHEFKGGYVDQDYLGVEKEYYKPTDRGYEAYIQKYLADKKKTRKGDEEEKG